MDQDADEALEACAQDFLSAVNANDYKALARAMRAAFDVCESMPHYEGDHINEETE